MASSNEEDIPVQCITKYCLVDIMSLESYERVYLNGEMNSGTHSIFKEIIAWQFEISNVHPEILVLTTSKNWIKLQQGRKSYEDIVRLALVTVYLLHLAKKNPDASATPLWSRIQKLFSTFAEMPYEKGLLHHKNLISAALSVDNNLIRFKYLLNVSQRSYGKEVTLLESAVPTAKLQNFVVDDKVNNAEDHNHCEDDVDELYDRVWLLCDDCEVILCCDGGCMRSFHATNEVGKKYCCESQGFTDRKVNATSSFMCQNSIDKLHQCFACGLLGPSGCGEQVFRCTISTCVHSYHLNWVAKLINPKDATNAADLQNQISEREPFNCPALRCSEIHVTTSRWLILSLCLRWLFMASTTAAQLLPPGEVATLSVISSKLKLERYWTDISQSSCSRRFGLNVTRRMINVTCDCSFDRNTNCHVTNIQLKELNLTGVFPEEFTNVTNLKEIDLTRNYINGTIPWSLSKLPLVKLSALGNRLSGSIPKEIGDIATLEVLNLEDNQLQGSVDANLGNLERLSRLVLSGNNLTGSIPATFGNLKNLVELRIDGNSFSGTLPSEIGNLLNLNRLHAQGANLNGPIPATLSRLTKLTELKISDLGGPSSSIPDLRNMTKLRILVLRNCKVIGTIPDYLGSLKTLRMIDLSFNQLAGTIPESIQSLNRLQYMFLANNSLGGAIPGWVVSSPEYFDVSYNNFTSSPPASCHQSSVNLVSSMSTSHSALLSWCLKKDLPCPKDAKEHSLFINCGGSELDYEGDEYEEDLTTIGFSHFNSVGDKWASSSTGVFETKDRVTYTISDANGFNLSGIYSTARSSPLSLKYYGLCLMKGSYNVRLHFAETMFTSDETFSSLGERIFDIAIQGNLVEKNFNIAKKANGVGKPTHLDFEKVFVDKSTLEIGLYWAGKGTMAIPHRPVYGPLISAIEVRPNFDVRTGLSAGAIAGIVGGCVAAIALILIAIWKLFSCKKPEDKKLRRDLELHTRYFTLRKVMLATNNFAHENKIGEGGFGPVYKGVLSDGTLIAAKQLSSVSKQGIREFINEIGLISALQHPNLVKLLGCSCEGNTMVLVYEYMANNSLARALFDDGNNLDWSSRKKICRGIAKGLAFLHEESSLKIIHRDMKATNVLLDEDLNAKISDFGLAKLNDEGKSHISTRAAGTIGYMAPEYAAWGHLSDKADVYSFGIITLEAVSGQRNNCYRPEEEFVNLHDRASVLQEKGSLLELVDPRLGTDYEKEQALGMLNVALACTNRTPSLRPSMLDVVKMLEGEAPIPVRDTINEQDARLKELALWDEDRSQEDTSSSMIYQKIVGMDQGQTSEIRSAE